MKAEREVKRSTNGRVLPERIKVGRHQIMFGVYRPSHCQRKYAENEMKIRKKDSKNRKNGR